MACIKSVNRSASTVFAPDAPYLASGTMAGAVDLSFSSSANLEIFKLDFTSDDRELPLVGEAPSTERFNRLSWGKAGSLTEEDPLGLIAGGLVDGNVNIWNPHKLLNRSKEKPAPTETPHGLVANTQNHTGPVLGLEFNNNAPHLLASGAVEGEISIWDFSSPAAPFHYPPLRSGATGPQGEITYLSWNHVVDKILATTSSNGKIVVWDLRRQKPAISFTDPDQKRCSVLQWSPDAATQLIVASDDDSSPILKLWDVRNTIASVKDFVGHSKGVIAMSWCPIDSSFLLTCAKDNRTICWDTVTGEMVSELPIGTNWNFDVHWYPKIPGVVSASSFDGKIGIYNIEACSRFAGGEADFSGANFRAPKWFKRPVGASFGFGGKLVSFHPSQSSGTNSVVNSEVYVHSLVTEKNLVSRSTEFEAAIQDREKASLRILCDKKSEESKSEDDRETWGFLKVMFEDDGTARTKLLSHLGFSALNDSVQDEISQDMSAVGLDERIDKTEFAGTVDASEFPLDNGEDFFNNLQSPRADPSLSHNGDSFVPESGAVSSEEQELEAQGESNDSSFDESIQRTLVVGDYKEAVSLCVSANRVADAFVIAHLGGASLWESTRDQYLKRSHSPYLKVVYALVNNDLIGLVNTRPLNQWKETLALLCTFAEKKEWTVLCDSLASRLMGIGNTLAATLCYICAGNIGKTVEIWSRNLKIESEGQSYIDLLQDLIEKTIILTFAIGEKQFSPSLSKVAENYCEILASQGQLTTAMEYLKLLEPEGSSQELAILRDRMALSSQDKETPTSDNTQSRTNSVYSTETPAYNEVDNPQPYYQPIGDNYPPQYNPPYYGGQPSYQTPVPSYQPSYVQASQPQPTQPFQAPNSTTMFTPQLPAQQVTQHQPQFASVSSHPSQLGKFNPTPTRELRNVEQYQQPTTLGSHLYPGGGNATYQPAGPGLSGPPPTATMTAPPNHPPSGFRPSVGGGFAQRPGMIMMQPQSPTTTTSRPTQQQQQPTTTAAPVVQAVAAPPPTIQTVDTSNVPAGQRGVIATLTRLFNETSMNVTAAKKREVEDNSRKIGMLFAKLNSGDISKNAGDKLVQLCQAIDAGDFATAIQLQVNMTTSDWDECNFWLTALKRMIKLKQSSAR
ncbi:hypothetical protein ACHQM5_028555 [Ranunculus cassubicifolius]